jgi:hypothetical protein
MAWRTTEFTFTAGAGDLDEVQAALADPRTDPMAQRGAALVAACAGGHLPVVEQLLALKEVEPTPAALVAAARAGQRRVVARLLDDIRMDPTADGCAALVAAAAAVAAPGLSEAQIRDRRKLVERIIDHPRIGRRGKALLRAAARGDGAAMGKALADPEGCWAAQLYEAAARRMAGMRSGCADEAASERADDAGSGSADDAGSGRADDAGSGSADGAGSGRADEAGSGRADDAGSGRADDAESGSADEAGSGPVRPPPAESAPLEFFRLLFWVSVL